jgi:hypothetical protein
MKVVAFLEMRTAMEGWIDGCGPGGRPYWMCCKEELWADLHLMPRFERNPIPNDFSRFSSYKLFMSKIAYRPLIARRLRTSVPRKEIRKAVEKIRDLRKTDPAAYRALVEKHKDTVIRIVPG